MRSDMRSHAPQPVDSATRSGYVHELDGVRAGAVIAVMCFHAAEVFDLSSLKPWAQGGFLGVSTFFTLSGFVIMRTLLRSDTPEGFAAFQSFWARRARRLLPAAALTLLGVAVLSRWERFGFQQASLPREMRSGIVGLFNWEQIRSNVDYVQAFAGVTSPLRHLWTIAVEEQTYIALSVLILLVFRGRYRSWWLPCCLGLIALASLGSMLRFGTYSTRSYMGTDTRIGEIAIGALAAWWSPHLRIRLPRMLAGVAALGILVAWSRTPINASWLYHGGFLLLAGGAAVVFLALDRSAPIGILSGVLRFGPLQWIGKRSYGIYLFHWPILLAFQHGILTPRNVVLRFALAIAVTLLLAGLSFRYVESPIRNRTMLGVPTRAGIAAAGGVALVVVSSFTIPSTTGDLERAVALRDEMVEVTPAHTSLTPGNSDLTASATPAGTDQLAPVTPRIMLIGDSLGAALGLGVKAVAEEDGTFAAYDRSIVSCAITLGGTTRSMGYERPFRDSCYERPQILQTAYEEFHPNVVLIVGGFSDIADRRLSEGAPVVRVGDPAYDELITNTYGSLITEALAHDAIPVLLTLPQLDPVYAPGNAMAPPPYDEAEPWRSDRFNALIRESVQAHPGAQLIDIAGWMQNQPGGAFSPALRTDGVHLNLEGAKTATQWLLPQLRAFLEEARSR